MKSALLDNYPVLYYLSGTEYNFRSQTAGDELPHYYQSIGQQLAEPPKVIYSGVQVHGSEIVEASLDGMIGDDAPWGRVCPGVDGFMTNQRQVGLLVKFADCTPIVLYDPCHHAIGIVHSGWRGTVQQISVALIKRMNERYQTEVSDLIAYIGPSIDQEHYQVGQEVYDAFRSMPLRDQFFKPDEPGHYLMSMTEANATILESAGIDRDRMEINSLSTYTTAHLHSSRRDSPNYGLNALLVALQ